MDRRRILCGLAVVAAFVVASCGGSSSSSAPTASVMSTSVVTTSGPTNATTSTATSTTAITTTDPTPTVISTTTTAAPSTTIPATTTTTTLPLEPECDLDAATAKLDETIALARLTAGGAWSANTDGIAFDGRTNTVEEWADHTSFLCAVRVAQRSDTGAERLALIGWNDRRHALVIQATDEPSTPYSLAAEFQLFFEQPRGEFLVDQFVWAARMSGGESIVVGASDYSIAIAAKSWQVEAPDFQDLPVTTGSERYAVDALRAAGARNVAVAEPTHSPIAAIMFHSPLALGAIATVGPTTDFDPMVPITADAVTTSHDVDGVVVRTTSGTELGSELYEAGFVCGEYGWRLEAILGSPAELLEVSEILIESGNC